MNKQIIKKNKIKNLPTNKKNLKKLLNLSKEPLEVKKNQNL